MEKKLKKETARLLFIRTRKKSNDLSLKRKDNLKYTLDLYMMEHINEYGLPSGYLTLDELIYETELLLI